MRKSFFFAALLLATATEALHLNRDDATGQAVMVAAQSDSTIQAQPDGKVRMSAKERKDLKKAKPTEEKAAPVVAPAAVVDLEDTKAAAAFASAAEAKNRPTSEHLRWFKALAKKVPQILAKSHPNATDLKNHYQELVSEASKDLDRSLWYRDFHPAPAGVPCVGSACAEETDKIIKAVYDKMNNDAAWRPNMSATEHIVWLNCGAGNHSEGGEGKTKGLVHSHLNDLRLPHYYNESHGQIFLLLTKSGANDAKIAADKVEANKEKQRAAAAAKKAADAAAAKKGGKKK